MAVKMGTDCPTIRALVKISTNVASPPTIYVRTPVTMSKVLSSASVNKVLRCGSIDVLVLQEVSENFIGESTFV